MEGPDTQDLVAKIRRAVLDGRFAPGQRLIEAELCELYQASRSAVRQALRELVADGLVEVQRNKGARVRAVSTDEAVEITEVRMALEGLLAAKAAERVTPEQAERLLEIRRAMREKVEAGDPLAYSELNAALHSLIQEIAGQGTARTILVRLQGQLVRHQFRLSLQPGRSGVSLVQHEKIVDAIVARDPEAAEAAMREHLRDVIVQISRTRTPEVEVATLARA
ncbi:DNA-binding GntR family transcriptional regulator [Thermocatellispora tengchongensis]|uniref:DNA-binding GntR family transcriptional regulator n=1 Tax=Thermocatellispora tengchongensis TaxID=1073253 RepID=A0A840PGJ2_9ACTN|nr:GntR family transcriptional regulator [Thermocatellispora tengchongensis]MBB5136610.1 DNA-binding GntR family transcriptional regulator [Thermocatellispora tengchongensis]